MCLLTTKKTIIAVLIFSFLVDQMLQIFGNVIALRTSHDIYKYLTCLTEDDGSAFVLNNNLIQPYPAESYFKLRLSSPKNKSDNKEIDCKMDTYEDCLNSWVKQHWDITNSIKTPMAPVFDERWEEFTQYTNENVYKHINFGSLPTSATALSFSVRALSDVYIMLCNSENYKTDFCYWIVIGGWKNTVSVIRKCPTGVPSPKHYATPNSKCAKNQVEVRHNPLSATEWRSFVIVWDSITRKITVYDTDKMIMTYVDNEELERRSSGIIPHINYQVFIRSNPKMLLRFHLYNFLYTTIDEASLTSPTFTFNDTTICIQMFIGLCSECNAHISLRDSISNEVLEMVTAKGSKLIHGLPTWQLVRVKKNFTTIKNVTIQLIPKLNTSSTNPLWAIANVRHCPNESVKRIQTMFKQNNDVWPNIMCQKLFYGENIIVSSAPFVRKDIELDTDCNEWMGPKCLISCEEDLLLRRYSDCKNTAICYKNGCTCPPGYVPNSSGYECSDTCELNKYGHNCKKSCGSCNNNILLSHIFKTSCDKVTGACYRGCNNTEKLYIPPLCHIGIDKSMELVINYTNETCVQVTVPMIWKDEYTKAEIFYSFIIQGKFNKYYAEESWRRILPNTTHLIGNFVNLELGITYLIKYALRIAESTVYSNWHTVQTDCIPIRHFDITLGETNLTINWQINDFIRQKLCPSNWYHLAVQHNNTVVHTVNESAIHFPYEVSSLKPYTFYNITILHKYQKLFFQEIRTHEGVPTAVLNLRAMQQSSNQVTLMWREPNSPNGVIVRYNVTVKVKIYYGCKDMQLPSPNNYILKTSTEDTTITISNLHPYAYYSASVTASNSHYNSRDTETTFKTNESDIPAEIFSQLMFREQILSWSIPDCITITGALKARIKIHGIGDFVKNFSFTDETKSYSYDLKYIISQLHGAEQYVAKVYVIRNWKSSENASAYQKYEFETPPAAPPKITNLDVVEIDNRYIPTAIYLRWQSPLPPLNGKLDYYVIKICDTYHSKPCQNISVQVNKSCDLWDNYICDSVQNWSTNLQIQILAYNINVTQPSVPVYVTKSMLNNTIPDTPENYTFTINNNSIIDLEWSHPWKTGGHLRNFNIWIEEISSNLTRRVFQPSDSKMQKYTVTHYMRYYNKQLYLSPSTLYHIHIQAVTVMDKISAINTVIIQTPTTIDFDGNINIMIQEPNSTILINIPPVMNETCNSIMHIIVKGSNFCEQYSKVPEILQAEINMDVNSWMQVAEGLISEFANSTFVLGNNETCGRATNCSLNSEGLYEIVIILTEENLVIKRITYTLIHNCSIEVLSQYHEASAVLMWVPYVICPIMICLIAATFYYYRRKKKQSINEIILQDGIVLSDNIKNCVSEDCKDGNVYEMRSVISTLNQNFSISFDKLSVTTTEEVPIAIKTNDKKEETASLIEDEDIHHYETLNDIIPISRQIEEGN